MSEKEKALQLCQSFGLLGTNEEQTQFNTLDKSLAKRCATLCVQEVLANIDEYAHEGNLKMYWLQVMDEIQII